MPALTETDPAAAVVARPEDPSSLENGDHMSREEFHRRYLLREDVKKAELIYGTVYMSSPVRVRRHGRPHAIVAAWLALYEEVTPGTDVCADTTLIIEDEHEIQPDALLRLTEGRGGRSWVNADDYFEGSPELVVEIAASTVSKDLHLKKALYRDIGVREYLVWRTQDRALDWFRLDEAAGDYRRIEPDAGGVIESTVFLGLRLAVPALLARDLRGVLAELRRGLTGSAHAEFVARVPPSAAEER